MPLLITCGNFDEWMVPVYAPAPFIPVRGEGSCLWGQQGKEYIDFAGGITINTLGYTRPALREALNGQASKFWHTGNGYTNEPVLRLAKKLIDATFAEHIFSCNSDTETSETALKLARKYAHDRFGSQKSGIVVFKNAFHGRTLFTVSAGGQSAYSQDLVPLPPDICYAVYNDLDPASQLIGDTTCVAIVESVQGEDGVVPATKAFLQGLRELCGRHDALLIFDEVQTGVGRTGEPYTYMYYGVTPDLLMTVKALGGGLSIGALLVTECYVSVMMVDTHGTAYGGNLLAAAVADKLLEIVNISEVLNGVKQRHDWFVERTSAINECLGLLSETRGLELSINCVPNAEFAGKAKLISQEMAVAEVMVLIAGANAVRFAPALDVSEGEVVTGLDYFAPACERTRAGGSS